MCVSSPKEPLFFSKNYDRGIAWYEGCFDHRERPILVDASPDYSRGPTDMFPEKGSYDAGDFQNVPERIFRYNPESKFIYVMRNPVSRTYSSYWHNVRAGYEKNSFENSIRNSDRYLVASDYLGQLKSFLKFFNINRFHFIVFEHFVGNFPSELERCCNFLDIDYFPAESSINVHKNASYTLSPTAERVRRIFGSQKTFKAFSKSLKSILPESTQSLLKKIATSDIPKISANDRTFLVELFSQRNAQLEDLTGLDLSIWKYN